MTMLQYARGPVLYTRCHISILFWQAWSSHIEGKVGLFGAPLVQNMRVSAPAEVAMVRAYRARRAKAEVQTTSSRFYVLSVSPP
jgi:hypothetical protein